MLVSVFCLFMAASHTVADRFPDYTDAKDGRQLANLGCCMRDDECNLRCRAWELLVEAQDAKRAAKEASIYWQALSDFLGDWDRKHARKPNSFNNGRMPYPFPLLRACHW